MKSKIDHIEERIAALQSEYDAAERKYEFSNFDTADFWDSEEEMERLDARLEALKTERKKLRDTALEIKPVQQREDVPSVVAVQNEAGTKWSDGIAALEQKTGQPIGNRGLKTALKVMHERNEALHVQAVEQLIRLQARVDELEKNRLEYVGVHAEGKGYRKGHLVTFSGSLWHANKSTTRRPGTDNSWTLAVKRGRDAR